MYTGGGGQICECTGSLTMGGNVQCGGVDTVGAIFFNRLIKLTN